MTGEGESRLRPLGLQPVFQFPLGNDCRERGPGLTAGLGALAAEGRGEGWERRLLDLIKGRERGQRLGSPPSGTTAFFASFLTFPEYEPWAHHLLGPGET